VTAVIDQVALTVETHRLQSELREAVETLRATQRRMVEVEKLRAAGTLAASVAHDIRNILASLQMELADATPDAESVRAQLARFSTLTHRLLAFSRPNVLETRPTSLAEVIGRVTPLIAGQAEACGVRMDVSLPEDLLLIAADASRIEHLFVNLFLNAIEAMSPEGGMLAIGGRAAGDRVEVTVRDTGRGVAAENAERIFDPFFTTRANGLGLGLFSCKQIAEEHGGEVTVANVPGGGACFTVRLPALER
jgi:two-component system sensor histidine kinase HydH